MRRKNETMISVKLLLSLVLLFPLLMVVTISNIYASGPRLDYDQAFENIPGAPGMLDRWL